jgi:hypothetical protein
MDDLERYFSEGPFPDTSEKNEVKEVDVRVKINDLGEGENIKKKWM